MRVLTTRIVSLALVILVSLTPEVVCAMAEESPLPQNQAAASEPAQAPDNTAPSASPAPAQAPEPQPNSATSTQQPQAEGTAAARAAKTIGGPASKPAGSAIAPAKQRQTRSLLIKIGAIAGAGAALGTVYALTRGTPTKPPGAH